jgi:hypothetical protein
MSFVTQARYSAQSLERHNTWSRRKDEKNPDAKTVVSWNAAS